MLLVWRVLENRPDANLRVIFNVLDHVRDVTTDDPEVVSTSGFRFPVERNPSRSTCSGDLLGNVYFRRERRLKVGKKLKKPTLSSPITTSVSV